MSAGLRLGVALIVAVLVVGGVLWWLERPGMPAQGQGGGADAATAAGQPVEGQATGRAARIEELRRAIEAQREALAQAREGQQATAGELEALRRELEAVRSEVEALRREAGAGDGSGES